MAGFIQLHLLTSYPPSNLNRDDLGRPKTAVMGGTNRLRISSQSLKRAWRKSEIFESALNGHVGTRTKEMGVEVFKALTEKGVKEGHAKKWAKSIAEVFGKAKKEDKKKPLEDLEIEQLAHFSPEEKTAINNLVDQLASGKKKDVGEKDLELLKKHHTAADISLFGRMLASSPAYNTEAAAQVAHAITVHKVSVENDYFTAVDDLNDGSEDAGSAHIGETEFAAGLFYTYVCIDCGLLKDNLGGDSELAKKTLSALVEASATVAPSGKQNSFASRARSSFILAEKGSQQPRSLSVAYLKPVDNERDYLEASIDKLLKTRENIDSVYDGQCADDFKTMNASTGEGSLKEIISFVTEYVDA